jgi:glyoxylase-like metal-dependent hydrolase (beta-lactamase superfamily II)
MLSFRLFQAGFCSHCQRMTLIDGEFKKHLYPALCALINHPKYGYILYDTGYSEQFFKQTRQFPFSLYNRITPVSLNQSLKLQLLQKGIEAQEINYIIISHFHSDHISGLKDFPNARFICHKDALLSIDRLSPIKALLKGFLPKLLPDDFYDRLIVLDEENSSLPKKLRPFKKGISLFDESLFAILLPGHAKGHIGIYFKAQQDIFLVGDSCWHSKSYQELILPSRITYLIHDNKKAYIDTLSKLNQLHHSNKQLFIIPSHCDSIASTHAEHL